MPNQRIVEIARAVDVLWAAPGNRARLKPLADAGLAAWVDYDTSRPADDDPDAEPPEIPRFDADEREAAVFKLLALRDALCRPEDPAAVFVPALDSDDLSLHAVVGGYSLKVETSPRGSPWEAEMEAALAMARWLLEEPAALGGEARATEGRPEKGPAASYIWLATAMHLVAEHPEWSDAKIAREVNKHPGTLSKNRHYQAAAQIARSPRSVHSPGGEPVDDGMNLNRAASRQSEAEEDEDDRIDREMAAAEAARRNIRRNAPGGNARKT